MNSTDHITARQYATGLTRENIEHALRAAGKNPEALVPEDLGMLEDFHSLGRLGTIGLIEAAGISAGDHVLDARTGIGGTARVLAVRPGCHVTAVDLTQEYCDVARWLNDAVGLAARIDVQHADVTALPFADASFDVITSLHVQMNIADKQTLYSEARRVLAPGGRLALWDITAGPKQPIHLPVPWADTAEASHLVTPAQLRTVTTKAGFDVAVWNDLTDVAIKVMTPILTAPPALLSLGAFVPDFPAKGQNLLANATQNRVRLIQAVLIAR